jgi:radical SAM family uncharacterized protein
VIGEGEEVIHEIISTYNIWKENLHTGNCANRAELLQQLTKIWGVYVPSMYEVEYFTEGTISRIIRKNSSVPLPVVKRFVPKLPPPVTKIIVPYIETVHNRVVIEIMRGCTRGCRFCHAGMVNRPVRERSVQEVMNAIEEALGFTGYEEVSLLSLSSSDYTQILELVREISTRFSGKHLSISLPSLRIESFSIGLMDALKESRRSGFTLAPEAGSEKLRKIINKPVETSQILETVTEIFTRGWHNIKLYFMIGHPSETLEDIQAIIDLCKAILQIGRRIIGGRTQVTAGVSTFIPKPHTPFQWVSSDSIEQINLKQGLLKKGLRGNGLKLNWNLPQMSMLEAWLSRGDRRMSEVIYQAWKLGAKFDAWEEHFRYEMWMEAFQLNNLDPDFYTHRSRQIDEIFPWDHISTSVNKKYLVDDYHLSLQEKTRPDCREQCFACGILPAFNEMRRINRGTSWLCPEVYSK